jgi:two-component system CheB/CheR fusion protein
VIQHLDPTHKSMLTELLSRKTSIKVLEVTDGMILEPNNIYVIPPTFMMSLTDNVFLLTSRVEVQARYFPIDYFLISLAKIKGNRALGVLLSGTGSDGTQGLRMIKAEAGITFAQDRDSAKYPDLPQHAIAAGVVDFVLPPKEIAKKLGRISINIAS